MERTERLKMIQAKPILSDINFGSPNSYCKYMTLFRLCLDLSLCSLHIDTFSENIFSLLLRWIVPYEVLLFRWEFHETCDPSEVARGKVAKYTSDKVRYSRNFTMGITVHNKHGSGFIRSFPRYLVPLSQTESSSKTFHLKMSLICMNSK